MKRELTDTEKARLQAAHDMAACYARLFLASDDGKRVLADILTKFPTNRVSFDLANPEPLKAAIIDGQKSVSLEIENAVRLGAKLAGIPYSTP